MSIAPFMWIPASLVGKGGGDNVDADKCRWRGGCAACDESECDNRDKSASDTEVEALRRRVAQLREALVTIAEGRNESKGGGLRGRIAYDQQTARNALAALDAPAPQPAAEVCRWRRSPSLDNPDNFYGYMTGCGEWRPGTETFCPDCGRRVEVIG